MLDLYKNIRRLRNEQGMSQNELARRTGYTDRSSIAKIEKGEVDLTESKIKAFADALGVRPGQLMGWDSPTQPKDNIYVGKGSFVQIPIYASVSAGPGCFAEGNIEGYTSIPDDMARNGDFFGLRVRGSSMDPEIKDQDVVVVRKTNVAESGDTVVAIVNGDSGFVKRLVKYAEGISLVSINATEYPPMIFTAKQIESLPVTIQGVVVRLIRDLGA